MSIAAAASPEYIDYLKQNLQYFSDLDDTTDEEAFEMLAARCLTVNTIKACCSDPEDEKRIRADIEKSGGFELLDKIIFKIRCRLAKEMLRSAARKSQPVRRDEEQQEQVRPNLVLVG